MNKKRRVLIVCCLLFAIMALCGAAASCSDAKTPSSGVHDGNFIKKDFDYPPDIMVEWGNYSADNIPQAIKG